VIPSIDTVLLINSHENQTSLDIVLHRPRILKLLSQGLDMGRFNSSESYMRLGSDLSESVSLTVGLLDG
jgi:hypothetical protein